MERRFSRKRDVRIEFCGHLRISDNVSAESPWDEVIRLLGDKENPHNRIK